LRRYARVLGVSAFVRDCLRRQAVWGNPDCCHHFVNTDRFRPDPAARAAVRDRLGADGSFVIVTVAHLIPDKGVDVLLRALPEFPPDAVVWVAGEGPEGEQLQALARQLGVQDRVRFLGNQARVEPYLQAADCFACPSVWAEAAGLTNLEAQACGVPVVASRTGGIPEYVADGVTGLLFPPGDPAALAACVRRLHGDAALRRARGEAARARAVERFSPEACLEAYLDLYRGVS
jgi:glycosyltransferase involved in cell wall biosynthesis